MQAYKKSFLVEWLTTVDHKKIGDTLFFLRYFLFVFSWLRGTAYPHPAHSSQQRFSSGDGFQQGIYDARHDYGFFGCYALERYFF